MFKCIILQHQNCNIRLTLRYIKESSTREMFYKRAGHAEISENLIYSKIVSLFENELIFGNWVTTPKLDVESFYLILVVCRGLFYLLRIFLFSLLLSIFYLLSRRILDYGFILFFSFVETTRGLKIVFEKCFLIKPLF